jgi:hypothetical protein
VQDLLEELLSDVLCQLLVITAVQLISIVAKLQGDGREHRVKVLRLSVSDELLGGVSFVNTEALQRLLDDVPIYATPLPNTFKLQ